jgi:hypothetical protein
VLTFDVAAHQRGDGKRIACGVYFENCRRDPRPRNGGMT